MRNILLIKIFGSRQKRCLLKHLISSTDFCGVLVAVTHEFILGILVGFVLREKRVPTVLYIFSFTYIKWNVCDGSITIHGQLQSKHTSVESHYFSCIRYIQQCNTNNHNVTEVLWKKWRYTYTNYSTIVLMIIYTNIYKYIQMYAQCCNTNFIVYGLTQLVPAPLVWPN